MATQFEQRPHVDEAPPDAAYRGTPAPSPTPAPTVYPAPNPYPQPPPQPYPQPQPYPVTMTPPYPAYPPQNPVADPTRLARGRLSGLFWLALLSVALFIPLSSLIRDIVVTFGGGFGHWVFSVVVLGAVIVGINIAFAVGSRLPR